MSPVNFYLELLNIQYQYNTMHCQQSIYLCFLYRIFIKDLWSSWLYRVKLYFTTLFWFVMATIFSQFKKSITFSV